MLVLKQGQGSLHIPVPLPTSVPYHNPQLAQHLDWAVTAQGTAGPGVRGRTHPIAQGQKEVEEERKIKSALKAGTTISCLQAVIFVCI